MNEESIKHLLNLVRKGSLDIDSAMTKLRHMPSEILSSACLDHHRQLRTGVPEAVFGENKTSLQLVEILSAMLEKESVVMATRVDSEKAAEVTSKLDGLTYHESARMLTGNEHYIPTSFRQGNTIIVTGGTSDLTVAEEARISLELFGHPVKTLYDVGVAGIHRILSQTDLLQTASVLIVIAGMEGALPTVVAGLVSAPVIGVPSSIGYGTGIGGFSALLGMLNSCAPGLAVVNIDNGFGAACMAAAINSRIKK